ncbi:4-alpha-glucanotransferase [Hydrogenimonas sp.]
MNEHDDLFTKRRSGVLLHPTSLPGEYGIGTFGRWAYEWVDRLAESGQTLWQMLPLGPTGFGNSPYQCYSAFAGNPLLIDLPLLEEEGLLGENLHGRRDDFDPVAVDYERVEAYLYPLLRAAFSRFKETEALQGPFETFCHEERDWLEDYALFMAIKKARHGRIWHAWERPLALRDPEALADFARTHGEEIAWQKFLQFLFFRQWHALKAYANDKGVLLVGDLPIYVAEDSADVWARPELFELDGDGRPRRVAGVPPDYFSETGQLWGNPLYDWERMKKEGYAWWLRRIEKSLELYDLVRIDHFRGFEAYWAVPAGEETARNGRWVKGPGHDFFEAVRQKLGSLPILAEDLGIITPEVERLRDDFGLPGMKILQFAFGGGADNPYLPHHHTRRSVVYTGTHDNDTTVGWFESFDAKEAVTSYLARSDEAIEWAMIREAMASVSVFAVVPMQDVLGLGSWARMNRPGVGEGNWRWRMTPEQLRSAPFDRLGELTRLYGR